MASFGVLVVFFSGLTTVMTICLVPLVHFGDKNKLWATRLAIIAFVAGVIFLVALLWWPAPFKS
jgi:hypothetical protein